MAGKKYVVEIANGKKREVNVSDFSNPFFLLRLRVNREPRQPPEAECVHLF